MVLKKQRKSLGDSLAAEFVYGESTALTPDPATEEQQPMMPPELTTSMDDLQLDLHETREATIRFTVDLPESMHRKLSLLSARTGAKKAHIVRKLLDRVLQDVDE